MTLDEAAAHLGRRLGVTLDASAPTSRVQQADVFLNGECIGKISGDDQDGFVLEMALLPADVPHSPALTS